MSMQLKPLSAEEREAFTTAYRFYERWHGIGGSSDDWLALAQNIRELPANMLDNDLCKDLIATVINFLSDKVKAQEEAERQAEQTVMTIDGKAVTF